MTTLSKILCVLIVLLLCFSFRYSLHDGNQQSSHDFVSTAKATTEYGDVIKKMIGGRKLMIASEDEVEETRMERGNREIERNSSKGVEEDGKEEEEETTMKRGNRETERKASKSVEEDGLVAYTADYWRAKHHPPKNN
ncbi:root meristem growth factor 3 isoform X2 [Arabidopsis lyrata subsp. lyrata]|uniref:root meristem growth factor 3 isoform X2 n=1 Tax=Arabidopsis lyrata subsp. lyrata TaxID=81972 RepID=UPI000A29AF42|nr:root meristem growth factor 3 isoform X2 [Arabidopsis lyrata subsp. lyrata]|eukprot:XP_020879821.1 root meristem growth factor 3 isoform X2 [Arabidopsis lyrata subsp. lyrata]